jgi:hypothetical protein
MMLQGGAGNWQAYWISASNGVFRIGGNGGAEPTSGALNIDYSGNAAFGGNTASNLGGNQTLLLKKIEELTLYVIEQDQKMAKMQSELDELRANCKLVSMRP